MFSLLAGFWQYLFARPNIHVLIIGLDYAGKTTLLEKIKSVFGDQHSIPPDKIPPTIGMNRKFESNRIWFAGLSASLSSFICSFYRYFNVACRSIGVSLFLFLDL